MPEAPASAEAAAAADPEGAWPRHRPGPPAARGEGKGDEALALAQKAAAGGGAAASAGLGLRAGGPRRPGRGRGRLPRRGWPMPSRRSAASVGAGARAAQDRPRRGSRAAAEGGARRRARRRRGLQGIGARQDRAGPRRRRRWATPPPPPPWPRTIPEAKRSCTEATVAKALEYVAAEPGRPRHPGPHQAARREPRPGRRPRRPGHAPMWPSRQADPAVEGAAQGGRARPGQRGGAVPARVRAAHAEARRGRRACPPTRRRWRPTPATSTTAPQLGRRAGRRPTSSTARSAELTKVTSAPGYKQAEAWLYLGAAHLGAKRYKDAVAALEQGGRRSRPTTSQVETYMAWSYFGLKDAKNFVVHGQEGGGAGPEGAQAARAT